MNCKDNCIHYPVCKLTEKLVQTSSNTWAQMSVLKAVETTCEHFKQELTATRGLHVGHKHYCSNYNRLVSMTNFCENCGAKVVNPKEASTIKYVPMISGFTDFCCFHSSTDEPIYLVNGKLYASSDLLVGIEHKYNFTDEKTKSEVEKTIQENLYMFDIKESNGFYYPNDNMFSANNAEKNISGQILTLKEKYK